MWSIGISVLAVIAISITHWIYKWRNPKCNGTLPPGSLGLPLIGETFQIFSPSKTLDIGSFVKSKTKKYGPMFKTSLGGQHWAVSSNADSNYFLLQQEGKLVETWYMTYLGVLLGIDGPEKNVLAAHVQYLKKSIMEHVGPESLRGKLLPRLEEMVDQTFSCWSKRESVEVKHGCSEMLLKFTSKLLFGYDIEKSPENLAEALAGFVKGLPAFVFNIPCSTSSKKCWQNKEKILKLAQAMIEEKRASPEIRRGDFLERLVDDMKANNLLTDKSIAYVIFVLQVAFSETITYVIRLAIKLLDEHPLVMQELVKENEEVISRREDKQTAITWEEYKSMTFTRNVINEVLRVRGGLGFFRRAIQDIHVDGYTIPKGWLVFVFSMSVYLDPSTIKDPEAFNPWRWKDSVADDLRSKYFTPFGGGMRACSGADFSKVLMAVFLHVLVTKYRWTQVKGEGNEYYIKVSQKPK